MNAGIAIAGGRVDVLTLIGGVTTATIAGAILGGEIFAVLGWERLMSVADRVHARMPLERAAGMLKRNGWSAVFTARLPAWDQLGPKLKDGFLIGIVFVIWLIPTMVLSRLGGVLPVLASSLGLLVFLAQPAVWSQYLGGGFRAALNLGGVLRRIMTSPADRGCGSGAHPAVTGCAHGTRRFGDRGAADRSLCGLDRRLSDRDVRLVDRPNAFRGSRSASDQRWIAGTQDSLRAISGQIWKESFRRDLGSLLDRHTQPVGGAYSIER